MRLTRGRQILVGLLAFALLLPLAGWRYEVYAQRRDRSRFPPAGRLVDVNHRNVHVLCVGTGTPTIVFEPSGFGNSLSSREARTALSGMTKVCSYDRMGTGWSDRGPSRITVAMLADDLQALADNQTFDAPLI